MAKPMAKAAPGRALDLAGMTLVVASVAWTFWTGHVNGGHPLPVAALQAGCAFTYVGARAAADWGRPLVPLLVVSGVCAALVLRAPLPDQAAASPPLGYANANAALYVLAAVAAAMARAAFPPGAARAVATALAIAFAMAAAASGSVTAVFVLVLAVVVAAARGIGPARGAVMVCCLIVQAAVATTAVLAMAVATGNQPALVGRAERLLDERRVQLWGDAAVIAGRSPVYGIGPGRFAEVSPTAKTDADARWAHSGFFQQAAEAGAVGFALVLAAFGWGFARLGAGPTDEFVVLGALALVALGVHASVDYVLHFPSVPLVTAALVGAAAAPARA